MKISEDGRRLIHGDGTPFFYLGDTAWELFHLLTREDAELYLATRAAQKFNVIQAVVLAEFEGLTSPNAYGEVPLIDLDPTRPNEAYFEHVDRVIRRGAQEGLWWGLLPTWGDKWNRGWRGGPEIFTPENARIYGRWLGERYRDVPLIWILGGDRGIECDRHLEIMRGMAAGLREGDGGSHLMTFHPWGGSSSSRWLQEEGWLDFNMLQSGHQSTRLDNHRMVAADYARTPVKPCMDAEPAYEDHPDMALDRDQPAPAFDDFIVRRAAYQAVFAGACGHAYGCHDIWQFHEEGREPVNRPGTFWKKALHLPGAEQMRHLRGLFERVPFADLAPDHHLASVLPSGEPVQALCSRDRTTALFYFPNGGTRTVQLGRLEIPAGETITGYWYDPRTGIASDIEPVRSGSIQEWTPPAGGPDWVLVIAVAPQTA